MHSAPPRSDEAQAIASLRLLEVLDSEPEQEFDALARAASLACGTPIALISLVDADRQWFKANVGLPGVSQTPRDIAFCAHAVHGGGVLQVPDAARDPRFADNPLVTGEPGIRFYAGAPIRLRGGHAVGTVCVIDRQPHALSDTQRALLECLALAAASSLEGRHAALQLRRAAAEQEERTRRLYEATPAMLHSIDAQGRVLMVSDTWLARTGYTRDQVVGHLSTDFLTPASAAYARSVVLPQFFASGHSDRVEYQVPTRDGGVMDVLMSARLERDAEGRPVRSLAVTEDITLRKRAERALQLERQRLANIIDGTDTATLEWNLRSGEMQVNRRFWQLLGREGGDHTSASEWLALVHPDDRAQHEQLLREHLAGQSPLFSCETRVRHADGHWQWLLTRGRVIALADDGQPEWLYGVRVDISGRKLHEEALRRSEAFLGRTGQVAGVGGWEVDLVTGQVTWSEQTRRIHAVEPGFEPTVAQGIDFYAPEARPVIQAAVDRCIATGEPWDLELPLIRADGRPIWARAVGSAEWVGGKPVRLIGAFQDITARMQLMTELADTGARLRDLYDHAPCGYHSLDAQGRFTEINATELGWLGCTHDEVVGRLPVTEFFTAEGRQQFERQFPQLMSTGRVEGLEFELVPRRGPGRRVSISATAVRDAQGRFLMSRSVMFDITELHRVRQDLRRTLAEQAMLLDNDLVGLAKIRSRHFVWANRGTARMFGYQPAELVGMPTVALYADPEDYRRMGAAVSLMSGPGPVLRQPLKMLDKHGRELWIDLSTVGLPDDDGALLSVLVDITPMKEAEAARLREVALGAENARLREVSRLKDQFLANMSHEFRTPLNAVLGFAQLLQSGGYEAGSPKHAAFLAQIVASGEHLLQLIESMLTHAQAVAGAMELHPAAVDLTQAVQEVTGMLQAKCEQRQVVIESTLQADLGHVQVDPLRLRQVLLNLVGNAVKFSHKGGQVQVRAQPEGDTHLRVEVEDHGIGIAPADLPRLFTIFTQLEEGNTKSYEGTGIGLALVRRLVEKQGGQVGVRSTPGVGSVFHFTLPRAA